MRRRPSTPSRSFSTIASKRNRGACGAKKPGACGAKKPGACGAKKPGARKAHFIGAALACALIAAATPAGGQSAEVSVTPRGGRLAASVFFEWDRADELISSLRRGLESRITFTTRLYEMRLPAFSFAGDRLVSESTISRSAFWDFLDQVFVVEEEGGPQKTYTDPRELIRGFFALDQVFGSIMASAARHRMYVSVRAQFEPVRLMPPLTLVSLVGAGASVSTPWTRREVP